MRRELEALDADEVRARARDAGLEAICGCDPAYPSRLRALAAPPAVLHVAGGLERLVDLLCGRARSRSSARAGRRRTGWTSPARSGAVWPSPGSPSSAAWRSGSTRPLTPARSRSAARRWRCSPARPTVPTRAGKRALHRRIVAAGAVVSELGPGAERVAVDVPGAQPDHRGARGDDGRGRGGRALGRAGDGAARAVRSAARSVRSRGGSPHRRRPAPTHCSPPARPRRARAAGRARPPVRRRRADRRRRRRRQAPAELRPLLAAIAEGHETAAALARAGFAPGAGAGGARGARARRVRPARRRRAVHGHAVGRASSAALAGAD